MSNHKQNAWGWVFLAGLLFWVSVALLALFAMPAEARTIRNDGGGSVARYAGHVEAVRLSGNTLRIGGDYCASACTMYLAVADCVDLDTDFAFHGPRNRPAFGPLSPERFEHWSMLMADHYPEPLREWFVSTARYEIDGFMMLKGRDLVAMGVANGCS